MHTLPGNIGKAILLVFLPLGHRSKCACYTTSVNIAATTRANREKERGKGRERERGRLRGRAKKNNKLRHSDSKQTLKMHNTPKMPNPKA